MLQNITSIIRKVLGRNTNVDDMNTDDALIVERIRQVEKCKDIALSRRASKEQLDKQECLQILDTIASQTSLSPQDIVIVSLDLARQQPSRELVLYVNAPLNNPDLPRVLLFADGSVELSLPTNY